MERIKDAVELVWCMPVISATLEVEIRGSQVRDSPSK
jgi:hypothetical protein